MSWNMRRNDWRRGWDSNPSANAVRHSSAISCVNDATHDNTQAVPDELDEHDLRYVTEVDGAPRAAAPIGTPERLAQLEAEDLADADEVMSAALEPAAVAWPRGVIAVLAVGIVALWTAAAWIVTR